MKIIIAGAGEVGTHLAKMLSQEKQDIILMDPSEERLNITNTNMEILPMVGNPTSIRDLEEAGIKKQTCSSALLRKRQRILRQVSWPPSWEHAKLWHVSTTTNICCPKTKNCSKSWASTR